MNGRAYVPVRWWRSHNRPNLYHVSFDMHGAWSDANSYATVDDFGNLVAVKP